MQFNQVIGEVFSSLMKQLINITSILNIQVNNRVVIVNQNVPIETLEPVKPIQIFVNNNDNYYLNRNDAENKLTR